MSEVARRVQPVAKKKRRSKPSTDKRVATELHSKIVRARGVCSWSLHHADPCAGRLECAHIIRRRFAATRTDLDNALCLCAKHHAYIDSHLAELINLVGVDEYRRLQAKADGGVAATGLSPLMFWRGERKRLTEIARENGLL